MKRAVLTKRLITAALILGWVQGANSWAVTLEGRLREKGTRKALADVNVYVLPSKLKATTDVEGRFKIEGVPEGAFTWVVNFAGFEKLEKEDFQEENSENEFRELYLEKFSYQVYETTVVGKSERRKESSKSLRTAEFKELPGAGGDPVKAVQNLPGVNRASGFSSQVIIQGGDDTDTKYSIDGHEVPLVFHFFALSSVVFPDAVDRVDYLGAGYGVENGRAQAGHVGLWTKSPSFEKWSGLAYADFFGVGAKAEGPLGEGSSFLIAARQSYVGYLLKQVLKNNESFDLTVAPSFSDLTVINDNKINDDNRFKVTGVGSSDSLKFLFKQPLATDPLVRGEFNNRTSFYRIIPQYEYRQSVHTKFLASLGVGQDRIKVNIADNYFRLRNTSLSTRAELQQGLLPWWKIYTGWDNVYYWTKYSIRLPTVFQEGGVSSPLSTGEIRQRDGTSRLRQVGLYLRNELGHPDDRWAYYPNLRVDYFSGTKQWLWSPRPSVAYDLSQYTNLKLSGGLYYQPPQPQESDKYFGNPDLNANRAWHANLNLSMDFREGSSQGFSSSSDVFYKYLDRQVTQTANIILREGRLVPEYYNNDGRGQVFGAQTQLKYRNVPWDGALMYTISRSQRWSVLDRSKKRAPYDQTHILSLLASREFEGNWKLSTRLRYTTGTPVTPISGATYDADNDVYLPQSGKLYSGRLKSFFQWDLRADKKWVFETWILSAYLDIQNITNRKNQEGLVYSYDYSEKSATSGLPIFPVLGIQGEF